MNARSAATLRALGIGTSDPSKRRTTAGLPTRGVVVWKKIADPMGEVLDVLHQKDIDELGARPRLTRPRSRLARSRSGAWELEERRCCIDTLLQVQRVLHRVRLPYECDCDGCGATFRIWMGAMSNG